MMIAMDGILSQFANLDSTTKWLLIVAVGMTIFYAVMRPMRKKKDPLEKGGSRGGLSGQRGVERDMTNLLVELSEMARHITSQLDTRTMKLEVLIKEADEKIAVLKELIRNAPTAGGNGHPLDPSAAPPAPAPAVDPRHVEVYAMADQKLSTQQIAAKLARPRGEIELILALRDRSPHA